MCDHQCRFTHSYIGNVDSVHDQRVFRLSEVYSYLDDLTKFPNDSHLLGDVAYTIHEHLLSPYRDNGHLTNRQKTFNFCHASARMAIERSFCLLKGRFRSLLKLLDMERIDFIPDFILICCVLHNISIVRNDDFTDIDYDIVTKADPARNLHADPARNIRAELAVANRRGVAKRDYICEQLPMRN